MLMMMMPKGDNGLLICWILKCSIPYQHHWTAICELQDVSRGPSETLRLPLLVTWCWHNVDIKRTWARDPNVLRHQLSYKLEICQSKLRVTSVCGTCCWQLWGWHEAVDTWTTPSRKSWGYDDYWFSPDRKGCRRFDGLCVEPMKLDMPGQFYSNCQVN